MQQVNNGIPSYLNAAQIQIIDEPIPENLIYYMDKNKYVPTMVLVDKLNRVFNYAWSFIIVETGMNESLDHKTGQKNGVYVWVKGQLTVPMTDPNTKSTVWITKEAIGGKQLLGPCKTQAQAYKSAASDSLKKAASMLGLANNVYMADSVVNAMAEADSWTEANMNTYAAEISKYQEYQKALGEATVSANVKAYCDSTGDYTTYCEITPSNIKSFLVFMADVAAKIKSEPASNAAPAGAPKLF